MICTGQVGTYPVPIPLSVVFVRYGQQLIKLVLRSLPVTADAEEQGVPSTESGPCSSKNGSTRSLSISAATKLTEARHAAAR
jgi:hypothetical protein